MIIHLDWYEVCVAEVIGHLRQIEAKRLGFRSKFSSAPEGVDQDEWDEESNIQGIAAEQAFGKFINRYCPRGVNTGRSPDVLPNYEVKWRRPQRNGLPGELFVYEHDPDDRIFVLMRGGIPDFIVVGWCYGWEGKKFGEQHPGAGGDKIRYLVRDDLLRKQFLLDRRELESVVINEGSDDKVKA